METLEKDMTVFHQPDAIDAAAVAIAQEIVIAERDKLLADKTATVRAIFDKLNVQYAKRRVFDRIHVGDAVYESTTIATRTADWTGLDEIFTQEVIYDPTHKKPRATYRVEVVQPEGARIMIDVTESGELHTSQMNGEQIKAITDEEEVDSIILDLVGRAEMAYTAYEMRRNAAEHDGLDPDVYSDAADADARNKLESSGYIQR